MAPSKRKLTAAKLRPKARPKGHGYHHGDLHRVLVSAGLDLALTLLGLSHGPAVAQAVQLALQYDPQPPYDAGSPATAPADIGELVSSFYARRCR